MAIRSNPIQSMTNAFSVQGMNVVVTGGNRGIGLGISVAYAQSGANVAILCRNRESGQRAADEIKKYGTNCKYIPCDIGNLDSVKAAAGEVFKNFGSVDVLVNNAGTSTVSEFLNDRDLNEWHRVINTNLKSVFRLSKLVLRGMMKARTGRIINISSVVASSGNPGQINYAASKAGVAGLSRSLAQEVGSRNITVNCVAPGFIDTAMTRALSDEQRNALIGKIPLGRLGQVEDIANAVAFLAGPEASYITGTMLHVNGGMYMV